MPTKGTLYIVATPIGHLGDLSSRVRATLDAVDRCLVEDTRKASILLQHMEIQKTCLPFHQHNEAEQIQQIISWLLSGESLALLSDAGTPCISDPGYLLVKAAHEAGVPVSPIPGPCAAITALSASGLPVHPFIFRGFLPTTQQARLAALQAHQSSAATQIYYEAPHRIAALCLDLATLYPADHLVCFARELTKHFESIRTDRLSHFVKDVQNEQLRCQGEFVVIVAPFQHAEPFTPSWPADLTTAIAYLKDFSDKDKAKILSCLTSIPRNEIYDFVQSVKKSL